MALKFMHNPGMLGNRLKKRYKHLRKWARRTGVTCYRLYELDIPEFPSVVDWYDGDAVTWIRGRKRDETPEQDSAYRVQCVEEIMQGLDLDRKAVHVKERKRQRGVEQYERLAQKRRVRHVKEQGLTFEVNLSDYLDTGLFLDHRNTRAMIRERAEGKRFLNLFAYTGAFTCYALDGRASATTTVDMSRTYCDWAARNIKGNGFSLSRDHTIVQADCLQWLDETSSRKTKYDLILCDPPTFSNSKRMEADSFSIDRDYPMLIRACMDLLAPDGEFFFSSNSRRLKLEGEKLPMGVNVRDISKQSVPEDFRNRKIHQCWILSHG